MKSSKMFKSMAAVTLSMAMVVPMPVSYTHLTLPTKLEV